MNSNKTEKSRLFRGAFHPTKEAIELFTSTRVTRRFHFLVDFYDRIESIVHALVRTGKRTFISSSERLEKSFPFDAV